MTRNLNEFVNQTRVPRLARSEVSQEHVCILLALYNGADLLPAQLASLAAQSHRDWSLIISDDGSTDDWLEVATDFAEIAAPDRTWLIRGPGQGYTRNFLSLAKAAGPHVPFVAFCDQDDVWAEGKLAQALRKLRDIPDGVPGLYCSRTIICDHKLEAQRLSPLFRRPPAFANALVQNIGGGNTMVLNRAALDIIQDTLRHANGVVSHDWWAYQLVSGAGGTVIFDEQPTLLYRQHAGNLIGSNDTFRASARRFLKLLAGRYRTWNAANVAALNRAQHWLTAEARQTLQWFTVAREGRFFCRLSALRRSGVYRQTWRGTAALWFAALTKRL